jgi:hypothetical protein
MSDSTSFTGWRGSSFYLGGALFGEVRKYRGFVWRIKPPDLRRDFTTNATARAWVESEARLLEIAELA